VFGCRRMLLAAAAGCCFSSLQQRLDPYPLTFTHSFTRSIMSLSV
jgi:hypothetical protein